MLTNDTRLADGLTDPSHAVPRVYLATVRGRCDEASAARLEAGLRVDGEPLAAAAVTVRKASGRETLLTVTLTEGRNREVRRLLAAVGHEVTRLKRVAFVGTPCQIKSVRRMQTLGLVPSDAVHICLGLFCSGIFTFGEEQVVSNIS